MNYKMKVTPEESEQVQRCCFNMDMNWFNIITQKVRYTEEPFLFIDFKNGDITHDNSYIFFKSHKYTEITPQEFLKKFSISKTMKQINEIDDKTVEIDALEEAIEQGEVVDLKKLFQQYYTPEELTIRAINDKTVEIDGKKYALIEEPKKEIWEPRGGEWYVDWNGSADPCVTDDEARLFGNEFRTKAEAQWASKQMAIHNWFVQLRLDFCPEFEEDWENENQNNWEIYFHHKDNQWKCDEFGKSQTPGIIYFSEEAAEKIVEKLNNGEIVIPHFLSENK